MEIIFDWLLSPIDPSRVHAVDALLSWHARLMVLAWGVIAPLAVLVARYFKIMPRQNWPHQLDSPHWWRFHWACQTVVIVLSALGLGLVLAGQDSAHSAPVHRILGYLILTFAAMQALSGVMRGTKGGPTARAPDGSLSGDHYDMTRRRLIFEAMHKGLGYGLLASGAECILLGLWAANAQMWMWLFIPGWWAMLIAFAGWLQFRRGAYDTYQAIWGPDERHPGNRMKKQGWGTVRPGDLPRFRENGKLP